MIIIFLKLNLKVFNFNGHNILKIMDYLKKLKSNNRSTIAVMDTVKGNGIKIFENNLKYSHGQPSDELLRKIINNIKLF